MSISDTAEYWEDIKRPVNRSVGAVHYRPLDKAIAVCGWEGGNTTPNKSKVNCRECKDEIKSL